ncbi:hypothetical protein N7513_011512 [Penicillium frequentans]|nr:hypothetical protein N7513_011512 [Penicillium glabrum]
MDARGAAPRTATVGEMANILLAARGSQPPPTVGKNWPSKFVNRRDELRTRYSVRYDYQRALNEDPKAFRAWFATVQRVIDENGIQPEDIYNFDETGFGMGLIATQKVISRAEWYGRRRILQPGNREWVTAIEAISADGYSLPPCVIFKGKVAMAGWFTEIENLPKDWRIEVSDNGWTTDRASESDRVLDAALPSWFTVEHDQELDWTRMRTNERAHPVGSILGSCTTPSEPLTYSSINSGSGPSHDLKADQLGHLQCGWKGCTYTGAFTTETSLWRHIKTKHVSPGQFKCPFPKCGKCFSRKDNYAAHVRLVHSDDSFECPVHKSSPSKSCFQEPQAEVQDKLASANPNFYDGEQTTTQ